MLQFDFDDSTDAGRRKAEPKAFAVGYFRSIEEVIHEALAAQDSEAEALIDQRESIDAKIARGIAQLYA